jgi:hypothetical protein
MYNAWNLLASRARAHAYTYIHTVTPNWPPVAYKSQIVNRWSVDDELTYKTFGWIYNI